MIYSNNWNITLPINQNFDLPIKDVEDQNSAQKTLNFSALLKELALHTNSINELNLDDNSFLNLQIKKAAKNVLKHSFKKSHDIDDFYSPYIQFQDDIF